MEMVATIAFPDRVPLATLPTRIFAPPQRLTDYLGDRELLIKRDDETGCGTSGNKIRKLELFAAEALAQGADTLITGGNRLSNHARISAIVARELGLDIHLVLSGNGHVDIDGNILLDKLLGATIHYVPSSERWNMGEVMDAIAADLLKQGRKPYIIPAGGSAPLGVMAYMGCAREIKEQLDAMGKKADAVTVAVGSGSTAAGLMLGARAFGLGCPVYAVHISRTAGCHFPLIRGLIEQTRERFGIETEVPDEDINVITGYVGTAYGEATPPELAFIHDIAQRTGLLLDPIYTGKAFRGTLEEIRDGVLSHCRRVVFVHTGGIYGLFSFRDDFGFCENGKPMA